MLRDWIEQAAGRHGGAVYLAEARGGGTLTYAGTYATGGNGTGAGLGSQGAVTLSGNGQHLFAVNAASNSVSEFFVKNDGLKLEATFSSNGVLPIRVSAEDLAARSPASFDVVTCMELLEHVLTKQTVHAQIGDH